MGKVKSTLPECEVQIMPTKWHHDIKRMHEHYGFTLENSNVENLAKFVKFRMDFLQEELDEMRDAETADDVVDALIDICVIAIGTLDLLQVDSQQAWDRVLKANMLKRVGVKETRPQDGSMPDLVKPEGWKAPTHYDNVGLLSKLY
jgi:predicted HAD superfamily Cof-like phosphohydrolase